MCGFVGFVDESQSYDRAAVLRSMADAIAHRGPDSDGYFDDGWCALGFRRLSIIDLEGATQPLYNEDGSLVLVFNGEIYNYRELRQQLGMIGHLFATQGDAEVVLHGFEQWGPSLLERLRGMFAFALWNRRTGELFCARDTFGIKPLYYQEASGAGGAAGGGALLFASEIKGMLPHPNFHRQLNEQRLLTYLCMEYQPDDATLFAGVRKLPAGHWLLWKDGKVQVRRWFWPHYMPDEQAEVAHNADRIQGVLQRSVAAHAVADVEVGCFLSAGVDSSLVAYETSKIMDAKTFSIGWGEDEERYSELEAARDFADAMGLRNFARTLTAEEFFDSVAAVQYAMDEPLPNPSAVPLYHLCRMAAEQVKVVMSGEGADELFGGYPYYQECLTYEPYMVAPVPLRRAVGAAASLLPVGTRGRRFLMRGAHPLAERYIRLEYNFPLAEARALLSPEVAAVQEGIESGGGSGIFGADTCGVAGRAAGGVGDGEADAAGPFRFVGDIVREAQSRGLDEVTAMQTADILTWMQQDILLKADKMSMAASLELRVPFLDREVFAVARTLPTEQRVTKEQTKLALRKAAARTLPPRTAAMPKKGFLTPLDPWLREDRWANRVREVFHSETAQHYFNVPQLDRLLDDHQAGRIHAMKKIWSPYCFILWHDRFLAR